MASKSKDSSRPPLPLPPGVMPSESRQNIEDLLKKTAISEDKNEILKEGEFGENEKKRRLEENQVEREPVELPAKAWLSAEEREEEQLLSSPVGSPLSYHIDLDEKTGSQGSDGSHEGAAATTSVKVVEASEDDIDQQRKQLFSLFSAGLKENVKEYPPASTTRSPWRGMTPLRRYNKVAPSPQKMTTKTPTTTNTQTIGKENRKQSLQASSESSLLDGSPSLKKITKTLKAEENGRPESAPIHSQRSKKHTSYTPLDTMVIRVEPHHLAAEGPAPVSANNEPIYSKVMKVKSQQKQHENPYEEPAVSPPASPLSSVAAKLDFSSASHTSNIVHMMSTAADEDKVNDSLYDSIRQPQSNEQEAADEPQFNPAFYKGLQRHDQAGNIHLIAVRGTSELLDSANDNFTHGGSPGMLPIHYAAGSGNKKALREILSSLPLRQDPVEKVIGSHRLCWREGIDAVDGEKRTSLMHAVHGGHYDCVLMLIEAGANLNAVAADGSTSLHDAAYSGTAQMVALLLSLGCNGLIQDTEGRTALHWSTYNRSSECIEMLLDKVPGLHPDVKDKAGMTSLMWAAYNGRPDNVQMLRQKRADTSLVDIDGMRAVHWSVQKHEYGALHVLINPESSQSRDYKGKTVMHQAAEQGCAKAIEMIAAVRPNSVNDLDLNGRTPLHWAAVCENPEAVRGLLANGADPAIKDTSDRTALDYAQERGFHYISLLLCQSMNVGDETSTDVGGRPYHRVLSFGDVDSIGVKTLLQQERMSLGSGEVTVEHLTEEQLVHVKSTNTGAWINKFTCEGKGPLHPRFFWIDPVTMRVYWSKSIESRYIHSKETKSDTLVGVRSSASPTILHRKDFDPMGKHKFAFSIFTSTRVLNLVALSSEDFKTWLNGLQLLLYLGSDQAVKIVNGTI